MFILILYFFLLIFNIKYFTFHSIYALHNFFAFLFYFLKKFVFLFIVFLLRFLMFFSFVFLFYLKCCLFFNIFLIIEYFICLRICVKIMLKKKNLLILPKIFTKTYLNQTLIMFFLLFYIFSFFFF